MTLAIGRLQAGGIVFVPPDSSRPGIVVACEDLSSTATWDQACQLCKQYRGGGFADWYLPSREELAGMYRVLHSNGLGGFSSSFYWSGTEHSPHKAFFQNFVCDYHFADSVQKDMQLSVRPVRRFHLI